MDTLPRKQIWNPKTWANWKGNIIFQRFHVWVPLVDSIFPACGGPVSSSSMSSSSSLSMSLPWWDHERIPSSNHQFCIVSGRVYKCRSKNRYQLGVAQWPPPSNTKQQDYYMLRRGSLSAENATVTERGPHPKVSWISHPRNDGSKKTPSSVLELQYLKNAEKRSECLM